ncbi:MAG: phosphate ABC transporter permease subunit PstC [Nitrospirota bacterium]
MKTEGPEPRFQPVRSAGILRRPGERAIEAMLLAAALASVAITLGIVGVLLYESAAFFRQVAPLEFFTDTQWTPLFSEPRYGIAPLVCGTVVTTAVALAVAVPAGTIVAVYLSEYASPLLREIVKPVMELLSAVPTVVYGYFALLFVTPLLQRVWPELPGFNMLSAGLVIGVMIIPYVSSVSEDAMRAVPLSLREGSYALGATRMQTAVRVVVPCALSGMAAAYVLAVSRAIGETMVVAIAAGMQPTLTWNPLEPAATLTAYIVQVSLGDLPHGSIGYRTIFAAGLVLFLMTLAFNIAGHVLRKRLYQAY